MKVRVLHYRLHKNPNFSKINTECKLDRLVLDNDIFHEKEVESDVIVYKIPFVEVGPRIGFFTNNCKILKKYRTAESLDKVEFSSKLMSKAAKYKHLIPNEKLEDFIQIDEFFSTYCNDYEQKLELDFEDVDFNAVLIFKGTACSDRAKDNILYLINDIKNESILHYFNVNENGDYEYMIPYLVDEDYDGQVLMFTENSQVDLNDFALDVDAIALARMLGTIVEPSVELVDTFDTCFAYC